MSNKEQLSEIITLLHQIVIAREQFEKDHAEEHEYLRQLIEEYKERKRFWSALYQKVATGTIWGIMLALVSAVTFTVKGTLGTGN